MCTMNWGIHQGIVFDLYVIKARKLFNLYGNDKRFAAAQIREGLKFSLIYKYRKRRKFGGTKVWRIRPLNILAKESLANSSL